MVAYQLKKSNSYYYFDFGFFETSVLTKVLDIL